MGRACHAHAGHHRGCHSVPGTIVHWPVDHTQPRHLHERAHFLRYLIRTAFANETCRCPGRPQPRKLPRPFQILVGVTPNHRCLMNSSSALTRRLEAIAVIRCGSSSPSPDGPEAVETELMYDHACSPLDLVSTHASRAPRIRPLWDPMKRSEEDTG